MKPNNTALPGLTRHALAFGVALWLTSTVHAQSDTAELALGACSHRFATPADAECGELLVPENPKVSQGRQIALNVMRVPAASRVTEDPLFILVGGPGGAAVQNAHQYLPYFRAVQQKRDIVFVDQRGTGGSNNLRCPFEQLQFAALDDEQRQHKAEELAKACRKSLDAELQRYTTPYAVADLEHVRQALGYERINLWGVSYGTRVALHYMRNYPAVIRSAVLDGVAPVSIQLPRFAAEDGSRAFARLLKLCDQDSACQQAFGDLAGDWRALLKQLERNPASVTLVHPRSQQRLQVLVTPATLSGWVQLALYSRELAPLIPQAVAQAVEGNFTVFGGIALMATDELSEQISQGLQATILCAEDRQYANRFASGDLREDTQPAPQLLQLDRAELFDQLCEFFPSGDLADSYFAPVNSSVPTLLLSGELDPVTPPRWAEQVAETLSNSRHLVVEGAHHGVTMQGCVPRIVARFIERADTAELNASCTQHIKTAPFFIDGAGPKLSLAAKGEQP